MRIIITVSYSIQIYARCIPEVNKTITQQFYFSERVVSVQYNTGGGSANKSLTYRFSGMYSMRGIVERMVTEVNNHSKANGGVDVLKYIERNDLACWETIDTSSMTFKILSIDLLPVFGIWQAGSISTGEEYTRGNLSWKTFDPLDVDYRETKICYNAEVRITVYKKSDNTVFCPEYKISIPSGDYTAFDLNELIMYAACVNCTNVTEVWPQGENMFKSTIGETNYTAYTTKVKDDYWGRSKETPYST